ncbi:Pyrroline-5-carboxylate reductase [Sulfurovum sp. enrichment culture clone C5]|uniref:Pyrroline-5-carboxylate reductase n=1 Tax=Sulfurovum sp. enrichment culture clone C5 TaxID=497650 RepID=A0A0S4XQK3_9BACT|nr:Pyrroline-5-carboxylate reductase [Sulfurovum sp. enrichment culture clone C5]
MKLSLIGSGSMATALALGLEGHFELEIIARNKDMASVLVNKLKNNIDIIDLNDANIENKNIILCTKPYALEEVASKLNGKANSLISILASTSIEKLSKAIEANHIVRAMPNVSAKLNSSTTTITGDKKIQKECMDIFNSIGDVFWVDSEKELDVATAIAGSGPAFLALVAEAMMDGGVKQGLKRDDSIKLVSSLFKGFAPLLNSSHPALIKDSVMSPAGTTAAGYSTLEEYGVRDAFIKAIEAAFAVTQK